MFAPESQFSHIQLSTHCAKTHTGLIQRLSSIIASSDSGDGGKDKDKGLNTENEVSELIDLLKKPYSIRKACWLAFVFYKVSRLLR